jgi:galactokinase
VTAEQAIDLFTRSFGRSPLVVASAPGRVNLIGEHTDYNGGEVLPMAIAQRTWVAMSPGAAAESRAVSAGHGAPGSFNAADARPSGGWWDYVHGVLRGHARTPSHRPGPRDIAVTSTVPEGAGLSSSAALEVAASLAALAIDHPDTRRVDPAWESIAVIAHEAETQFIGVGCGIMDQTVSAHATTGHALRIWCDTGRREDVRFARAVLVIDTVTPRALRDSAFNERQRSCERALRAIREVDATVRHLAHATPELIASSRVGAEDGRRARHVVGENRRVGAFVSALAAGESLGGLLRESHESLRLDYECSTPELDWVVDFASGADGIDGARMTGAGWGGCAIAVGAEDALRALASAIVAPYEQRWKRRPRTWLTHASEGARLDLVSATLRHG